MVEKVPAPFPNQARLVGFSNTCSIPPLPGIPPPQQPVGFSKNVKMAIAVEVSQGDIKAVNSILPIALGIVAAKSTTVASKSTTAVIRVHLYAVPTNHDVQQAISCSNLPTPPKS